MSGLGHNFPPADELPIPEDVVPGPGWTDQMLEMADHIGAYRTLLVVERFGGQQVYVTADPEKNPFRDAIGPEAAAIVSHVYRRERLQVPVGRFALRHARRQAVIAAVRAKQMTGAEAARILNTSRTYVSYLVNQTDEGEGKVSSGRRPIHVGQMQLFGDEEEV